MIRILLMTGFAAVLICCFASGCVIKTQKGHEYVFLDKPENDYPDKQKDDKEAAPQKTESGETEDDKILENALADDETANSDASSETASAPEDFSASPWWKKDEIKVHELSDAKESDTDPLGALVLIPEEKEPEAVGSNAETESPDKQPETVTSDEPMVVAVAAPEPRLPEKRIFEIDRHIQPISASLWNSTYDSQTSKQASPQRRAGMSKVKSAIETGYGTAYVAQLEKAISLDRDNGYAYYFLARGRFEDGDWAGSKNFAEKSVQLLDQDRKFRACAKVLFAKSMANLGDIQKAALQAREATIDDPQNTEARILALKLE